MSEFNGKTVLITGSSRDIGRACAVAFGADGANVVINYNSNKAAADDAVAAVEAAGGKAIAVKADVTKKSDVDALVKATLDAFGGKIDVLVNNAGGLVARKKLPEMDEDFLNWVMQLNFTSAFMVTQAVVPHMPKGSAIVNLGSLAGRDGAGGGATAYGASKGALMTWTRGLSKELGPDGIRVNGLAPGMIDTTFHDTFTPDAARRNVEASVPLRRQGTSEDCANLVYFLASDKSAYLTGANVDINGGMAFS
jgi:3-oxoacyl-[acyl-carrier protein] reductase